MAEKQPDVKALTQFVQAAKRPFTQIAKHSTMGVTWEAEAGFAMQAIKNNPTLAACTPTSIRDSVINVASVGLSLNPTLQHAALVPRFRKGQGMVCCLDPMYRGLIHVALEGGGVVSVRADVVRQADIDEGNFKYTSGTNPSIIHNPNPFASSAIRGPIVGAYVVAELAHSRHPHVTALSKERLDFIRGMSEAYRKYGTGVWVDHEEEMCKKSAIKVGSKTWGTGNVRIQNAIALANVADGYDEGALEGEATVVPVVTSDQARELRSLARRFSVPMDKIYAVYSIDKIENLPEDKLQECRGRVFRAGAVHAIRHASDNSVFYAKAFEMSQRDMKAIADEIGSQARVEP